MPRPYSEVISEINAISQADSIYQLLCARKVRGHQNSVSSCPLAQYIKLETSGDLEVSVCHESVWLFDQYGLVAKLPLSDTVRRFTDRFDRGRRYRDLRLPITQG